MYTDNKFLSDTLKDSHRQSWTQLSQPGDFWTAAERVAIVSHARAALSCEFCKTRKAALSPNGVSGEHKQISGGAELDATTIDTVHRIRTDPGRLTREWFDSVMASDMSSQAYAELVSIVATTVIIDTLHQSLGATPPTPIPPATGEPNGQFNTKTVDEGGWLPMLAASRELGGHGLPAVPNIARALGLVPSALNLFFQTFRPHYALENISLSISQAQAEFVASRVSAINECFY